MSDTVVVLTKRPATVKNIHNIDLGQNTDLSPLQARKIPQFQNYFDILWKELENNETK